MSDQREDRLLVTGASGFVGRAFIKRLAVAGVPARAAVRDAAPLSALPLDVPEAVAIGEIGPATDWREALAGVGTVVHLAGRAHVLRSEGDGGAAAFMTVNFEGTLNLARQAAAAGIRRFVFVSSVGVNGRYGKGRPFRDSDAPLPVGPYASSKWRAEQGLREIGWHTGMEVVIVRPPLIYGKGARGTFPLLVKAIRRRLPLPIGGIVNLRSFIGVDNLTDFLLLCGTAPHAAGHTFLVSDDEDVSTPEFARCIAHAMGIAPHLIAVPPYLLRVGAAMIGKRALAEGLWTSMQIDMEPTRRHLSWTPPLSLAEGLARAVRS